MNFSSTVVIFGASSEIANSFITNCTKKEINLILISRKEMNSVGLSLRVNNYLEEYKKIYNFLSNYSNLTLIFFNGALFENRPIQFPSEEQIQLTKEANFSTPYLLCKKLNKDLDNIDNFIFISSMAAVRQRYKNYIYGSYKRKLEDNIKELDLKKYLIIRFGKVVTKMSEGHRNPPFTMEANDASRVIHKNMNKEGLIYGNTGLFLIAIFLKLLPNVVLKKIQI
jgi:hypothetical protein